MRAALSAVGCMPLLDGQNHTRFLTTTPTFATLNLRGIDLSPHSATRTPQRDNSHLRTHTSASACQIPQEHQGRLSSACNFLFLPFNSQAHLTPGISGAPLTLRIKEMLGARPLHAVVRWANLFKILCCHADYLQRLPRRNLTLASFNLHTDTARQL